MAVNPGLKSKAYPWLASHDLHRIERGGRPTQTAGHERKENAPEPSRAVFDGCPGPRAYAGLRQRREASRPASTHA